MNTKALLSTICLAVVMAVPPAVQAIYIPEPEEIYEAFVNGLIEYPDYIALMEISRGVGRTPADSLYLRRFPDLLIGLTANPYLIDPDESPPPDTGGVNDIPRFREQAVRYRQYQRLTAGNDQRRLYRIKGTYDRLTVYGEFDQSFSGRQGWKRRSVEYRLTEDPTGGFQITIGNYNDRFGLGIIYGYHGQLFSKTGETDDLEKFLYPGYGGSNGIRLVRDGNHGKFKLIYDKDQSREYGKDFFGLSAPFGFADHAMRLSAGCGRLRNRIAGSTVDALLMSVSGEMNTGSNRTQYELAVSRQSARFSSAAAIDAGLKRGRTVSLRLTGWSYDRDFPSWFSGGPSSRRYRTLSLDEIDMKFSDRAAGETGLATRTRHSLSRRLSLISAAGYAWRGIDDNRVEARAGVRYKPNRSYQAKFDCYWRADNLYSGRRSLRRMQMEFVRENQNLRIRMVIGHRYDKQAMRNDYLLFLENRIRDKFGKLVLLLKLDRLLFGRLRNNYLYAAISHETNLGRGLSSYIKFSRRYRRGQPGNSYDELRWDLNWAIK